MKDGIMLNTRASSADVCLTTDWCSTDSSVTATTPPANPSFIGDFDLQYLLYPSGNLALKVYNQTNDRYFTKSSLNTQGIGIIMKKDFNNLRDLFSSQKKKKKRTTETEKRQKR